jgi:hypothetical protein
LKRAEKSKLKDKSQLPAPVAIESSMTSETSTETDFDNSPELPEDAVTDDDTQFKTIPSAADLQNFLNTLEKAGEITDLLAVVDITGLADDGDLKMRAGALAKEIWNRLDYRFT